MGLEIGARGGIGERDVWEAADALLIAGARPTVERVRAQIGRGSPNTVGPLLDGWFKALGGRIQNPSAFHAEPARPDVPEPVLAAARKLWDAALEAARLEIEASLQSEREELARIRADLEQGHAEFATERSAFEAEMRAQRSLVENYEAQLGDARAELGRAQLERTALIAGQERLQRQHEQERTAQAEEVAAARADALALREEISVVRDACDRDMKDALLKLDRARTETAASQKSLVEVREKFVRTAAELDAAQKQAGAVEKDRALLQSAFDTARADVQSAISELERQRTLARNLQAACDTERARNGELVELLARSQDRIAEGLRTVARLRLDMRQRLPSLRRPSRIAT